MDFIIAYEKQAVPIEYSLKKENSSPFAVFWWDIGFLKNCLKCLIYSFTAHKGQRSQYTVFQNFSKTDHVSSVHFVTKS